MASVPLGRSTESAGGEGSVASRFWVQARGIGASDLGSSLGLVLRAQNLRFRTCRTCASGVCGHSFGKVLDVVQVRQDAREHRQTCSWQHCSCGRAKKPNQPCVVPYVAKTEFLSPQERGYSFCKATSQNAQQIPHINHPMYFHKLQSGKQGLGIQGP